MDVVKIVPFDWKTTGKAFASFRPYGEDLGHPTRLNITDCAASTVAKPRNSLTL